MAWILATLGGQLWTQKSPQGLRRAGFQDFSGQFWYRRKRILVGWRNLNESPIYMKLNINVYFKKNRYT
ncbi:hypothetical protein ACSVIH_09600 [Pantoea ananatis]|uniref:hypothetical protein n=1 Tax=Pantoea ananas TaxID=553 RepID=UPI003F9896B0